MDKKEDNYNVDKALANMEKFVPLISNIQNNHQLNFTPSEVNFSFRMTNNVSSSKIFWNREDCFLSDGKSLVDYILVYQNDVFNLDDPEEKKLFEIINSPTSNSKIKIHNKRRIFQYNLKSLGLKVEEMKSEFYAENKIVYVLISAPFHVLSRQAEILKLKMPLLNSEDNVSISFFDGWFDRLLMKLFNTSSYNEELQRRFELKLKIKNPFVEEKLECFENCHNPEILFPRAERSRLVYDLLLRTKFEETNNYEIGIEKMVYKGFYNDAFPLHEVLNKNLSKFLKISERTDRELLYQYWASSLFKLQPLDLIKRYFGTKIAMYFAWLGYYTKLLVFPSILGLLFVLIGLFTFHNDIPSNEICGDYGKNIYLCPRCDKINLCNFQRLDNYCTYAKLNYIFDNYYTVIFSIIMCIWATLFLEGWKQYHAEISYKWGILDFEEEDETIRPDFQSKIKNKKFNPITQEEEPYVSRYATILKWFCSGLTILFFILLVLGFGVGIIIYKMSFALIIYGNYNELYKNNIILITSMMTGMVNVIFILLLNRIYNYVAYQLTCWECPKTQSDFDNSFALKVFLFQFVNYYSSLFYIAFVKGRITNKPNLEQCGPSGCMIELVIQLASIMIGKQFFAAICGRIIPLIKIWITLFKRTKNKKIQKEKLKQCDKDYMLNSINQQFLFYEYLEMVVQFGFVTLFVTAFPLAPFFAFINNVIEIRIDAMKFVEASRRPIPAHVKNIGIWEEILNVISYIAVFVNASVIAFTSDFIPKFYYLNVKKLQSLHGFVEFSLSSINSPTFGINNNEWCRFRGFYLNIFDNNDNINDDWWKILVMRCAFVIIFEHIVFGIKKIIAYFIPNIPKKIVCQLQRERFLARSAILKQYDINIQKRKRALYKKIEKLKLILENNNY